MCTQFLVLTFVQVYLKLDQPNTALDTYMKALWVSFYVCSVCVFVMGVLGQSCIPELSITLCLVSFTFRDIAHTVPRGHV